MEGWRLESIPRNLITLLPCRFPGLKSNMQTVGPISLGHRYALGVLVDLGSDARYNIHESCFECMSHAGTSSSSASSASSSSSSSSSSFAPLLFITPPFEGKDLSYLTACYLTPPCSHHDRKGKQFSKPAHDAAPWLRFPLFGQ